MKRFRKIKKHSKLLAKAKAVAKQVEAYHAEYQALSFSDLKERTHYLIEGLANQKFSLEDIMVDAFAIARELIYRQTKMLAFRVQIIGAYIIHMGDFAEMYTGEGKTLTIMLAAFLNALKKEGVHIVTVNEYLVQRDAQLAETIFAPVDISVGYNIAALNRMVKKDMFAKDIIYTTNSELGFDYLRDNMVLNYNEKVIRKLYYVIVDEADSVLIDEARTPLIISGQPIDDLSLYLKVDQFVSQLHKTAYVIDHESNTITLSTSGIEQAQKYFQVDNLYSINNTELIHKITNALIAHYVFSNGKEYLVKHGMIMLIDQFTGRILEGRSYNAGLQQAIQAKERVQIEPENITLATITYQSLFRLYTKLAGVSGTAITEAEEFLKIYNMVVVQVPTNKPVIRKDYHDYVFATKKAKWNHVVAEIEKEYHKTRPVLVGTASVSDSEIIAQKLKDKQIPYVILNARDNTKEALIVQNAGKSGSVTISTNMAGRGTDIKIDEKVKKMGGLYVIGTERHESRRIDNQLRGRAGRQGDPGQSRFFISLEDSLFKRFAAEKKQKALAKMADDEYYNSRFFSKLLNYAQKKVEGLNFDIRKNLMDYDHVLSLQREIIYKQRDAILLQNDNQTIINNMIGDFVHLHAQTFVKKTNPTMLDTVLFCRFLNDKIIYFPHYHHQQFVNQSVSFGLAFLQETLQKTLMWKMANIEDSNLISGILLMHLDQNWTQHIDKMLKLREGVNLRSLEQKSPLNIYVEEGNALFEKMQDNIVTNAILAFCALNLANQQQGLINCLPQREGYA